MPPLRGLGLQGRVFLQRYHPYGIQEILKASRFPRRIRFGWETEPTGPGGVAFFYKDTIPTGFK